MQEPMFVLKSSLLASYSIDAGECEEPLKILPPPGLEFLGEIDDADFRVKPDVELAPAVITSEALKELTRDVMKSIDNLPHEDPKVILKEYSEDYPITSSQTQVSESPLGGIQKKDEIFKPLIDEWSAQIVVMMSSQAEHCKGRWWTASKTLCPLSNFPICLLPYPPFKLRISPEKAGPHKWVDGKFLALMVVASGQMTACGRYLQSSDLQALDEYMQRCKLGTFRPGHALKLASDSQCNSEEDRQQSANDLNKLRSFARTEFCKLRQIQRNRLMRWLPGYVLWNGHQRDR